MSEPPLLSVRNLKKFFPVDRRAFRHDREFVHAVDDVSFDLAKGEPLGLVGDDELWVERQRSCEADPLALTAGEFMRKAAVVLG